MQEGLGLIASIDKVTDVVRVCKRFQRDFLHCHVQRGLCELEQISKEGQSPPHFLPRLHHCQLSYPFGLASKILQERNTQFA